MKRLIAFAAAVLMLVSSFTFVSSGDGTELSLSASSTYRFSEDREYVVGIEGIPDESFVRAQFNDSESVTVTSKDGEPRQGKIASEDVASNGSDSVKLLVYGDVDRSSSINARDVIAVMKYLCRYDEDICVLAADVNADGKTNALDVVILMRFLIGADVILGDITYPAVEFQIDSSYRIVIGENADDTEEEAAKLLCTALDSLYGQGLGTGRIIPDSASAKNEIILGKTNRQLYSQAKRKLNSEGYFYDIIKPSRIVIGGSDSEGTYEAVNRFLWDNFAYIDKFNTVHSAKIFDGTNYVDVKGSTVLVSGKSLYYAYPEQKADITLNGVPIEEYTVVPKNDDFAPTASILVRNIRILTGKMLTSDVDYTGDNAIYVGRISDGGNYTTSGLAYNIGREGTSIYIDAYRLNVTRFAVRAFTEDHLFNSFESRDIVIEGNTPGAFNSNRLRLTSSASETVRDGITYYERSYTDRHSLKVEEFVLVIKNGAGRLALGTPNGETAISGTLATTSAEMRTLINAGKDVICGINADFFNLGGNNYPLGLCIKDGTIIQQSNGRAWFAVLEDGSYKMGTGNDSRKYIDSMVTAVGGSHLFVRNGKIADVSQDSDFCGIRHPRTALGYTAEGDLVFIVVDGRRPNYSNGASLTDLALLMLEFGVTDAINLDGGGSSTMAIVEDGSIKIKNSPCDVFERAVYDSIIVVAD